MSKLTPSLAPPEGAAASPSDGLPQRFGKYTLLRKIATGGMAEIFLALQRSVAGFEKLVVIKRILPLMNSDKAFIDMLLHEARIAATLSHPNIVQTFDVGMIDDLYYIAMEHIHGEDIRTIVRQMKAKGVPGLPLEHALAIVIGQCSGLAYAHEKRDLNGQPLNIVHRDISPQNVVVTFSGDVKIVDFGIAKSGVQLFEETKSGQIKGKIPYMAPEQAAGEDIDWRSDIFATGVMLFELTTGRRLFKSATEFETLKLICEKEYPRPSQVRAGYPARLERIVMKALAKQREERYQSAREMQADLEAFVRDERIPVSQIALAEWMERLFADKLAAQKEALQDIKHLADVIAAEQPSPLALPPTEADSMPSYSATFTAPAASITLTDSAPLARKSNGMGLYVGLGLITLVAGGAIAFALRSPAPRPELELARNAPVAAAAAETTTNRGKLRISSEPPGAAVWINGDLRPETTPATIERLPIGAKLEVKLTKDGYEPFKQDITIAEAGPGTRVDANLRPGRVTLQVKVVNAQNASYWLDGKPVGPTIEGISPGEEHKLEISAPGYATKTTTFRAQPGETKVLEISLDKSR